MTIASLYTYHRLDFLHEIVPAFLTSVLKGKLRGTIEADCLTHAMGLAKQEYAASFLNAEYRATVFEGVFDVNLTEALHGIRRIEEAYCKDESSRKHIETTRFIPARAKLNQLIEYKQDAAGFSSISDQIGKVFDATKTIFRTGAFQAYAGFGGTSVVWVADALETTKLMNLVLPDTIKSRSNRHFEEGETSFAIRAGIAVAGAAAINALLDKGTKSDKALEAVGLWNAKFPNKQQSVRP